MVTKVKPNRKYEDFYFQHAIESALDGNVDNTIIFLELAEDFADTKYIWSKPKNSDENPISDSATEVYSILEKAYQNGVSDAQLYKQFGNAVAVNVIRNIAQSMKTFLTQS